MVKITRRDGRYYCDGDVFDDADGAYRRFRDDYNISLGKRTMERLDSKNRRERIHGTSVYMPASLKMGIDEEFSGMGDVVQCRLAGIVCISYCWALDECDCPDYEDGKYGRWLLWLLSNSRVRIIGRKSHLGRTKK